jgi:tRNA nucleotidyltransferase (CCA-adding enzyme)
MEIYLVGGAVRDKLLGLEVKDRDFVVVGSTPEEMIDQGFKPVGSDFPVFLHPETKEEYALARTERKSGHGYKGFKVYAAPDVSLEDDLLRRDLTINAMAEDLQGNLIDPHNGRDDLDKKLLRHVSPAFSEDPVRVLRAARFAARFGFHMAHETHQLLKKMVNDGELDHLVAERVWSETERALGEKQPTEFFRVLRGCGALKVLFPEIDDLYGVPQPEAHHPEIDTGVHVMMVLEQAAKLSNDVSVRFAALTHDLGKGNTPESQWPKHIAHEARGVKLVKELCDRLKVPNHMRELAIVTAKYHTHCHRARELKPETIADTLQGIDGYRRPERLEQFLLACEADARGRKGYEDYDYTEANIFRDAYKATLSVDAGQIAKSIASANGKEIAEKIRAARVQAIRDHRNHGTGNS